MAVVIHMSLVADAASGGTDAGSILPDGAVITALTLRGVAPHEPASVFRESDVSLTRVTQACRARQFNPVQPIEAVAVRGRFDDLRALAGSGCIDRRCAATPRVAFRHNDPSLRRIRPRDFGGL